MPSTTPAAEDGAAKTATAGKRAAAADTPPATDAPVEADAPTAETPPADTSGWFRNTGPSPVTAMFDDHPSIRVEPGQTKHLPDDPRFSYLERCDAPDAVAADTTRSEP